MATQEEKFAIATHFYVRLRRHLNRVVDAVWMAQNDDYAREILRLARGHGHEELRELADRYEALLKGASSPPPAAAPVALERSVAEHYIGALR